MAEVLSWVPGAKMNHAVPPMDAEEVEMINSTPSVYIWNMSPREFVQHKGTLGRFVIPACKEGQEISEPCIVKGWLTETALDQFDPDTLTCTYKWLKTSGRKQAMDLVGIGPMKTPDQDLTKYGVFISASAFPTQAEKDAAKTEWHKTCADVVKDADNKYQVNGGMEMGDNGRPFSAITIDHVNAAKALGIKDKPWMSVNPIAMAECPHCGVSVKPGVAFCSNGDIIDEAKARVARPWLFHVEQVEEKRGPGRPPLQRQA